MLVVFDTIANRAIIIMFYICLTTKQRGRKKVCRFSSKHFLYNLLSIFHITLKLHQTFPISVLF